MSTPKINRAIFFAGIRTNGLFPGPLKQSQVDGIDAILDEWEATGYTDLRWLAYIFATAYHEVDKTMQPIEEYGKGKGQRYGGKVKYSGERYSTPDKIFYGRGFPQTTWYENYEKMGELLGIDLLNHPERALQLDVAVKMMFEGMLKAESRFGDFTGKCLEQYFTPFKTDWVNARKIINGLDKADHIADIGKKFYSVLLSSI